MWFILNRTYLGTHRLSTILFRNNEYISSIVPDRSTRGRQNKGDKHLTLLLS